MYLNKFLAIEVGYSTDLMCEIGGSNRGFRLEYEVFRYTVHFVLHLAQLVGAQYFVEISLGCNQPVFNFRF